MLFTRSYKNGVAAVKLARRGPIGSESPGILMENDRFLDLSGYVDDFNESFFRQDGIVQLPALIDQALVDGREPEEIAESRLGAPVARPHQIVCIGLNYADHAAETGAEIPPEPIIFTKSPNTLVGPNDPVRIPRGSTKTDWEVELAIVVGKRCSYLEDGLEGLSAIAGFMVSNDVSEREFQLERQGQWSKGKSCESFNPAGPWLVTTDEVTEPTELPMWLTVNSELMQNSSTSQMVFTPGFLVAYLSQFMVLEPGDVINTGTPPGVGMGFNPPRYLKPGDLMELGIQGLGQQRQYVEGSR